MVEGLIKLTGADIGVSVTGIAGPSGGTKSKPVGLVYIGVYVKRVKSLNVKKFQFGGDRKSVRQQAVQAVLYEILKDADIRKLHADDHLRLYALDMR